MKLQSIVSLLNQPRDLLQSLKGLAVVAAQAWWLITGCLWGWFRLRDDSPVPIPADLESAMYIASKFVIVGVIWLSLSLAVGSSAVLVRWLRRQERRRCGTAKAVC